MAHYVVDYLKDAMEPGYSAFTKKNWFLILISSADSFLIQLIRLTRTNFTAYFI
jgi:hypothetical protein